MCLGLFLRGTCCLCQSCCNDCCKILKYQCNITRRQQVRLAYIATSSFAILFAVVMMYILPSSLGIWSTFISCPEASGGSLVCLGVSAVYRMSAALVVLYTLMIFICLLRDDCSRIMNENFWCLKIFIILGSFFGFMFVSNDIFNVYGQISVYMGGIFLLFQIVMIIDLFYLLGERMKYIYDQGYNCMGYLLIIVSIIFYALTIYLNYQNFNWFPCNTTINTINSLLILIITILVITGWFPNGSLVTSGAMSLFLTYQIWAGLNNNQDKECNYFHESSAASLTELGFGVFFILCSLIYISVCSNNNNQQKVLLDNNRQNKDSDEEEQDRDFIEDFSSDEENDQNKQQSKELMTIQQQQQKNKKINKQIKRLKDYQTNSYILFHLVMILCSFYIAVVLTNWGAPVIENTTWEGYKPTDAAKNVNICCSYLSWVVYLWTLLAPKIFPDRDFSGGYN